jgi:hypothetical protein
MQGQHSDGVAHYRCRYPQEYALTNKINHPRNVIMREEVLIRPLDTWLVHEFGPQQRRHTTAKLVNQAAIAAPTPSAVVPAGPTIAECDARPPSPSVTPPALSGHRAQQRHLHTACLPSPRPPPEHRSDTV